MTTAAKSGMAKPASKARSTRTAKPAVKSGAAARSSMTGMKQHASTARPKPSGKPKPNGKAKANGRPKATRPKVSAMRPSPGRTLTVASPPRTRDEDQYGGLLAGIMR